MVRSRTDIVINLDASRVFEQNQSPSPFLNRKKTSGFSVLDTLGRTEIMQLYMKNSFEVSIASLTPAIFLMSLTATSLAH